MRDPFEGAKVYDADAHAKHAAELLTAMVEPDVRRERVVAEATAHALTAIALVLSSGTVYMGAA